MSRRTRYIIQTRYVDCPWRECETTTSRAKAIRRFKRLRQEAILGPGKRHFLVRLLEEQTETKKLYETRAP